MNKTENTSLTREDIQNILALVSKATISGAEAMVVAILVQKLRGMLDSIEEKKE